MKHTFLCKNYLSNSKWQVKSMANMYLKQPEICWYAVSHTEVNDIARDQLPGQKCLQFPVPDAERKECRNKTTVLLTRLDKL